MIHSVRDYEYIWAQVRRRLVLLTGQQATAVPGVSPDGAAGAGDIHPPARRGPRVAVADGALHRQRGRQRHATAHVARRLQLGAVLPPGRAPHHLRVQLPVRARLPVQPVSHRRAQYERAAGARHVRCRLRLVPDVLARWLASHLGVGPQRHATGRTQPVHCRLD